MDEDNWLADLYLAHKQLLLVVAWNVVSHRDLAEDAVHAAIARLAALPNRPDNPRAYAVRAVRNIAIDLTKQRRRHREEPLDETHAYPLPNRCETDNEYDRAHLLDSALSQLDLESRETIRLHLQMGVSLRELSELFGLPLQTVASRYRRGIAKLKRLVEVPYER